MPTTSQTPIFMQERQTTVRRREQAANHGNMDDGYAAVVSREVADE
ncbi:hypothetical protein [Haloarchaeobius sp. TZWSO28]